MAGMVAAIISADGVEAPNMRGMGLAIAGAIAVTQATGDMKAAAVTRAGEAMTAAVPAVGAVAGATKAVGAEVVAGDPEALLRRSRGSAFWRSAR
jgi:hypothetical protein